MPSRARLIADRSYSLDLPNTFPRALSSKFQETISVLDFIPTTEHAAIRAGTSTLNLTPYFTLAVAYVNALPDGGVLYFPRGEYVGELDISRTSTNVDINFTIRGDGWHLSKIKPYRTGGILLNMIGRNHARIEDIEFFSGDYTTQCAVFIDRSVASPNANNNSFHNVHFMGNFTIACMVTLTAESLNLTRCQFTNTNATAKHRCLETGTHNADVGVTNYGSHVLAVGYPNTVNVANTCEFYVPYPGAEPIRITRSGGWTFTDCKIIAGEVDNTKLVTYKPNHDSGDPDFGVFNGPITWQNCHMEVIGDENIIHYLDAPEGFSYFNYLNVYGGNHVVGTDTMLFDFDRENALKKPVMQTCNVLGITMPNTSTRLSILAYSTNACDFTLRPNIDLVSGLICVFDACQGTKIEAPVSRIAYTTGENLVTHSTAIPTVGTFPKATEIINVNPAVGQPKSWIATVGGTFGPLSVLGSITAGSNLLTVDSISTIKVGEQLFVAGVGAVTVRKVVGNSVYLNTTSGATVTGAGVYYSAPTLVSTGNL